MYNFVLKCFGLFINVTAVLFPKWNYNNSSKILSKVKRAGISEAGEQFLSKSTQHFFEIDGQSSVLYKWGNGPKKILFLHGWMSNSQRWLPYYKKLDLTKYTMYALDAPGHGKSTSKYLNLEMYRLAIESSIKNIGEVDTVVCHSFSNTALTYSFLVNSTMLINKIVVMGAPSGMDAIFEYSHSMLGLSKKAITILERKIKSILKVPHQQIKISYLLNNVAKPILVVHDVDDKITPFAPINNAMKTNLKLEKLITNGLKHDLKSEEVYNRVIKFISE